MRPHILTRLSPWLPIALSLLWTAPLLATGISDDIPWQKEGWQIYASYGETVAPAGDVNGDGFSDILVGAPEHDGSGVNEGRVFLHLGGPGGPDLAPDWTGANAMAYSHYGKGMGPAGDVNGDGYGDVVIGAWRSDFGTPDSEQGRLYVYYGSPDSLETTADWTYASGIAGARLGYSVCTVGDVNGDGIDDVLAGAPEYNGGRGRVLLFHGTPSGLSSGPVWTLDGELPGSEFGFSVHAAGDVNADGLADFLIGAPGYETVVGPAGGKAYLFLGGVSPTAVSFSYGGIAGARHGQSVATAGDVDGDGYCDVIIGAPEYSLPLTPMGRAQVFFGASTGLRTDVVWNLFGTQTGEDLGWSVGPAGDLNGDGYADVVVGSPGFNGSGGTRHGKVQVFLGNDDGLAATPDWYAVGSESEGEFGNAVTTGGDADGDGFADLLTGNWLKDDGGVAQSGRAYLWFGEPEGLSSTSSWFLEGGNEERLGWTVARGGDVNGDGYSDVLVASPYIDGFVPDYGKVRVYHGSEFGLPPAGSPSKLISGTAAGGILGYAMASAGDVDNDGYDDVVIGAPGNLETVGYSGHAYLYMGSAAGLVEPPSWSTTVGVVDAQVGHGVASGDVNGDGYSDVVVGAPRQLTASGLTGAAFVYLGSSSGLSTDPDTLALPDTLAQFGFSVGSGDFNGDGYSDVYVGSPYYSSVTYEAEGKVSIFFGSASGVDPNPDVTWTGLGTNAHLGYSVAGAGDLSNTSCEGILMGSPNFTEGFLHEGRARYVDGTYCSGATGSVSYKTHQAGAQTGRSVAAAGDVNGDGLSDLMFSAPYYTQGNSFEGTVQAYLGQDQVNPVTLHWQVYGGQAGAHCGWSVAGVGDVNGDGFDDVMVGAPNYDSGAETNNGYAELYCGGGFNANNHNKSWVPQTWQTDGSPLRRLGMSDEPDAVRLAARTRSAGGRVHARIEWNIVELGLLSDGIPDVGSWFITGAPGPQGSYQDRDETPMGLSPATDYAMRMRVGARTPFFPSSKWHTPSPTAWAQEQFRTAESVVAVGPRPLDDLPPGPRVKAAVPNPFSSRTAITYSVSTRSRVRLRIFDVEGRLVTTLLDEIREPGTYVFDWGGRIDRRRAVGSGVFFIRIDTEAGGHSLKVVYVH